jgi:hypothetical protein
MPLVAYQSFNSNASKTHDLASASMQPFTRQTNAYVTEQQQKALVLPFIPGDLTAPVEGPAHLVPIKRFDEPNPKKRKREDDGAGDEPAAKGARTGEHTAPVFGAQISLL